MVSSRNRNRLNSAMVPQQAAADLISPGNLGNARTELLGLRYDPQFFPQAPRRRRSTPVMISILLAAFDLNGAHTNAS